MLKDASVAEKSIIKLHFPFSFPLRRFHDANTSCCSRCLRYNKPEASKAVMYSGEFSRISCDFPNYHALRGCGPLSKMFLHGTNDRYRHFVEKKSTLSFLGRVNVRVKPTACVQPLHAASHSGHATSVDELCHQAAAKKDVAYARRGLHLKNTDFSYSKRSLVFFSTAKARRGS